MTENPTQLPADDARWVRTWGASPQSPDSSVAALDPIENVTLRQVVRISGGGHRVRIRLSNEFGPSPIAIEAGRLAIAESDESVLDGSGRALTFGGHSRVVVPAGAPIVSDPVELRLLDLERLTISLYVADRIDTATCHGTFNTLGWILSGDGTQLATVPDGAEPIQAQALISAVEVQSETPMTAIVAIGDSRVDGIGSTHGLDRRWTDVLAERLIARGNRMRAVINQGIGGNRLLHDEIGQSALARFDRDVLATPGLECVVISEGGNDLMMSFAPRDEDTAAFLDHFPGATVTAGDVIAAYRQLAHRARAAGVRVIGTTIAPWGGADLFSDEGERHRELVNAWIRTTDAFDGIIDFDEAWRDPAHTSRLRDDLHAGDHLHGNDAGYRALAESIDLCLFD